MIIFLLLFFVFLVSFLFTDRVRTERHVRNTRRKRIERTSKGIHRPLCSLLCSFDVLLLFFRFFLIFVMFCFHPFFFFFRFLLFDLPCNSFVSTLASCGRLVSSRKRKFTLFVSTTNRIAVYDVTRKMYLLNFL